MSYQLFCIQKTPNLSMCQQPVSLGDTIPFCINILSKLKNLRNVKVNKEVLLLHAKHSASGWMEEYCRVIAMTMYYQLESLMLDVHVDTTPPPHGCQEKEWIIMPMYRQSVSNAVGNIDISICLVLCEPVWMMTILLHSSMHPTVWLSAETWYTRSRFWKMLMVGHAGQNEGAGWGKVRKSGNISKTSGLIYIPHIAGRKCCNVIGLLHSLLRFQV